MTDITTSQMDYIRSLQADKAYKHDLQLDTAMEARLHERTAIALISGRSTTDEPRLAAAVQAAQATDRRSDERESATAAIIDLLAEQRAARHAEQIALLDIDPTTLTRAEASAAIDALKAL